jgi:hypothetical protein
MTKTTLMTLLRDPDARSSGIECLYVVRDDDVVFYVGKSEYGGVYRISEHWQGGFRSNDHLREFMRCAVEDGFDLNLEFLSIAECQELTNCLGEIDEAEGALIAHHCPVFNAAGNSEASAEVPQKYSAYWAMLNKRQDRMRDVVRNLAIK